MAEKYLIKEHLIDLVNENYTCKKNDNEGNYNSVKDFQKLRQLDLTSNGTLAEHIDLLRALTHGDFNNAYFIDEEQNKVFIKVNVNKEIS